MSATSLVTDGFICYRGQPIPVPHPATCESPDILTVVEVRPKIRRAQLPDDTGQPKPSMLSAQELKPKVEGEAQPGPTPTTPPKTTSAQELKPKIVKAEEED
jgi:hypothetical protein